MIGASSWPSGIPTTRTSSRLLPDVTSGSSAFGGKCSAGPGPQVVDGHPADRAGGEVRLDPFVDRRADPGPSATGPAAGDVVADFPGRDVVLELLEGRVGVAGETADRQHRGVGVQDVPGRGLRAVHRCGPTGVGGIEQVDQLGVGGRGAAGRARTTTGAARAESAGCRRAVAAARRCEVPGARAILTAAGTYGESGS